MSDDLRLVTMTPDALRDEVERRMLQKAWNNGGRVYILSVESAVSVAVEMLREERERVVALEAGIRGLLTAVVEPQRYERRRTGGYLSWVPK